MEARRVSDVGVAETPAAAVPPFRVPLDVLLQGAARAWADPYLRSAVALSFLALGLRVAWVVYADVSPLGGRFDDSTWYHLAGYHIAGGRGYVNPFLGGPTAMWPVGYPAVLGALYFVVGTSVLAAKLLNSVLGAATCLAAFGIGASAFDRRTGLGAALVLALFPSQALFTSILMSEVLSAALFAVLLLAVLGGTGAAGVVRLPALVAIGLVAGAATLVRGEMGLFPLVTLAYWGLTSGAWRRAVRYAAVVALAALVIVGPWFVRNLVVLDAPVVVSSSMGGNLWMGNHEGASGHFEVSEEGDRIVQEYVHLPPAELEVKLNDRFLREALSYMATHPIEELGLAKNKLAATYSADDHAVVWNDGFVGSDFLGTGLRSALKGLANYYYYGVLASAVLGTLLWVRRWRSPGLLLLLAILYWTAAHLVFFGDQRFHFAVVPALSVFAAVPFAAAVGWTVDRRGAGIPGRTMP